MTISLHEARPGHDDEDVLRDALRAALELGSAYLGAELGLYDALAADGPLTAAELAARAGIPERDASDWLERQAEASLVVCDAGACSVPGGAPRAPFAELLGRIGRLLPLVAGAQPADVPALVRSGDVWSVSFAGRTVQLRHAKGFDDLVTLLGRPDREVHCLELAGGADVGGDAGPALDAQARRAYEARIRDLQEELDDAQAANDPARAERAELELNALVEQLAAAFGLGGRARAAGSAAERARSAVTWRVRAAIRRICAVHPELGRHLRNAVRTGIWCSYRPESAVEWRLAA